MKLGEGSLKLWHWVGTSSLWGNGANPHPAFICKSCLDGSLKLISLLLVCCCAVWEISVCVNHIQAPTAGQNFCCKIPTMTGIVRDTRTQNGMSRRPKVWDLYGDKDLQSVLPSTTTSQNTIKVSARVSVQANGAAVQSLQEAGLSQVRKVVSKNSDQACNRDARARALRCAEHA